MLLYIAALAAIVSAGTAQEKSSRPPSPTRLRCEYLVNPIPVDVVRPRLSWVLRHPGRGQNQTAYQILVSRNPAVEAGEVWDTGRAESDRSTNVEYGGKPLQSGKTYYWKVRFWDRNGAASPYSRPARFDMGLLSASDWKGRWIGGANQLRKEFRLPARPVRGRAYVSGLGYYELRINGRKAGDHLLDPAWTTYDKRVLYSAYDVTELLAEGPNAVSLMLGQGWFGSPIALLQLQIECDNGQTATIVTDGTWRAKRGPIVADSIYNGEVYDARLETPGWDRPGFDDADWQPASLANSPKGVLSAQMMPPIRVVETIVPFRMSSPRPGVFVFDMGQNFSGWIRLRVRGPRGARVRLRHSELLYDDGTLNVENLRGARATDVYILRGDGKEEIYEPRFTYHGFRYVELTGYPGTPRLDTVRGRVVHTDVRPHGGFSASAPILNDLQRLIVWGITSNLHGIPTDCNQRDERMGWMADAHLYAEPALWNFDMAAFYTNFLRDIHDGQTADGTVTDTVPFKWRRRPADPAWGAAYPLLVWDMYLYYGDRSVVEQHYEGVKAWTDFLKSRAEDGILRYSYYGDWVAIDETPGELVSTFFYYYSARLVSRMAGVLGRTADAEAYAELASQIRDAFNRRFYSPERLAFGTGTQTAQVLALYLNLAAKEHRGRAWRRLYNDIVYGHNTHLTTGIIGTKYLMEVLDAQNRNDLAYELVKQTTYPSWGYMIEHGATTLWELWQDRSGPTMNSHNHPMFGSVGAWLYEALAGIHPDADHPGFERIRIAPHPVRDLRWASAEIDTLRGPVASSWRRTESSLRLEVTIPVGSEAEVVLPKLGMADVEVSESGRPAWKDNLYQSGVPGLAGAQQTRREIVFQAGSGHYIFDLRGAGE